MESAGARLSGAVRRPAVDPGDAVAPRQPNRGLLCVVLCVLGAALTAVPYGSFFASGDAVVRLWLGALAGGAAAYCCALFVRRVLIIVALGALGLAISVVYLALASTLAHGLPQAATLRAGGRALVGGWAAMLSVGTPAGSTPQLLTDPLAVTWITAFAAVALAVRTRALLAPAAVLVAAEVVALVLAAVEPATHLEQCAGLFVLVLVLSVLRADALSGAPRRFGARRAASLQAVAVLAAVAIAALGARALPLDGRRFDPATLLTPVLSLRPTVNPLAQVRAQLQRPQPRELFTVTLSGAGDGRQLSAGTASASAGGDGDRLGRGIDLIQTAALDSFDGIQWSSSAGYAVSGPVLAPGTAQPDATRLTERISVSGLNGPFLPSIGRPSSVTGDFGAGALVGFDRRSGTLVTDAATLSGVTYQLTSSVSPAGTAALEHAAAGTGAAYAPYLALPPAPQDLSTLAARITSGVEGPYAKAVAIERYLRQLPYNLNARPGESYAALVRMLDPADGQSAAGYAEQHVSAFAVLARSAGLPTRVAVGYALSGARAYSYTVTTADAYAWDQVYFQDYGWVDFDPTDPSRGGSVPNQQPLTAPPPSMQPAVVPIAHRPTADPVHTVVPVTQRQHSAFPWLAVLGGGTGLLLGAVAAFLLARLALRRRRRKARLSGGPSHRVAGAWLEICDRLTRAGVPISRTQTVVEVAQAVEAAAREPVPRGRAARLQRQAVGPLATLAPLTDRAVFSPQPVSESEAQQALRVERELRREASRIRGAAGLARGRGGSSRVKGRRR